MYKLVYAYIQSMQSSASVKPPDGKLVNVTVTYEERIQDLTLTGDFFLEPPEARTELEQALIGTPIDAPSQELLDAIEGVDATLIGFDAEDLVSAVQEALQ